MGFYQGLGGVTEVFFREQLAFPPFVWRPKFALKYT